MLVAGSINRVRGFTLLELLVVMTIMAVLAAAISSQLFSGTSSVDLRSAAASLADTLQHARSEAIQRNIETAVVLDVHRRTYTLEEQNANLPLPTSIVARLLTATQEVSSDGRAAIRFYPDGTSSGGGVELTQGGKIYVIRVDWLTGQIALAD